MRSRALSFGVMALLLAAIGLAPGFAVGGGASGALARSAMQQASPVPDAVVEATGDLPDDVAVALLGAAELGGLPNDGVSIRLERLAVPAGGQVTARGGAAGLLVVETGEIALDVAGDSVAVATGGQAILQPDDLYAITATGSDPAIVLRFTLEGRAIEAVPAAPDTASPVAGSAPMLLISGEGVRLDSRRGTLFIARVVVPAGADLGRQVFTGPVGVAVESGAIAIVGEASEVLMLEAGGNLLVPGFTGVEVRNDGDEPATLLVAGILAPATGKAAAPAATPTPVVDHLATAQAENAMLEGNLATLATREAAAVSTAIAQATALASAEAALATAEAELTALASTAADDAATAQAAAAVSADELAAAQGALATAEAGIAAAEATMTAIESELATVQAAATTAAEDAAEAEAEASDSATSLEATITALQTENTGQATAIAAADATVVAMVTEQAGLAEGQANGEATIAAQSTAIANANATATAQAAAQATADAENAAAQATADAEGAAALANAEATAAAYATSLAAAEATAAADAAAAETALAEQASAAAATASADAANAASTSAAQAAESESAAATAGADAANAEATIASQASFTDSLEGSLATAIAEGVAAEATIAALSTAQAETANLAVTSVNPEYVDVSIQIDLDGVIAGDQTAITNAQEALATALEPYAGCRAGVVLTFGHGNTIGQGTVLARALNVVIQERHADIFGGAAFDAFGDLREPLGQVDIRIYFFTGCVAAEAGTPAI